MSDTKDIESMLDRYASAAEYGPWVRMDNEKKAILAAFSSIETAYEVTRKDVYNLTEKVIPNLREQIAERDARIKGLEDEAIYLSYELENAMDAARKGDRPCTCHPDDNPPVPCPRKYALTECRDAARKGVSDE